MQQRKGAPLAVQWRTPDKPESQVLIEAQSLWILLVYIDTTCLQFRDRMLVGPEVRYFDQEIKVPDPLILVSASSVR